MLTVVDYGMGNLRSVAKAFEKVGFDVIISSNPEDIKKAKAIVVPGVGAFGDAIHNLKRFNLYDTIIEHVNNVDFFLESCLRSLKPSGVMFLSTINRTIKI